MVRPREEAVGESFCRRARKVAPELRGEPRREFPLQNAKVPGMSREFRWYRGEASP